ncbi:MAG: hypothetical protein OFPII_01930 [Osedax symbiont Rs1]|nr:MAG: hypothetical protein OFPII_01930 [Osedax symbiont Rs1]
MVNQENFMPRTHFKARDSGINLVKGSDIIKASLNSRQSPAFDVVVRQ